MHKFRRTLGASTLIHDKVVNLSGHDIGRIEELMIDVTTGRVAYAVLLADQAVESRVIPRVAKN